MINNAVTFLRAIGLTLGMGWLALVAFADGAQDNLKATGLVKNEFIFEQAPFPSCHASTIVETSRGLLAAWFGGTREGHKDVCIWLSALEGGRWTVPVQVADGMQTGGKERFPCWNPVLFRPKDGLLMLFYKVGPNPDDWWGMLKTSSDEGRTWSDPKRLPEGQLGPVRNKPVLWKDGTIVCGSSTEKHGWVVHLERTGDFGLSWERSGPLHKKEFGAIQPTILQWPNGRIQLLNRTQQGVISECWSEGDWQQWSPMKATSLPNPNSGIDAVMLKDGRALLVYNHTSKGRSPLNVAISDDGKEWRGACVLENTPGEYSYPAIIQAGDGLVHVTYTWKRQRIKHVVLKPSEFR